MAMKTLWGGRSFFVVCPNPRRFAQTTKPAVNPTGGLFNGSRLEYIKRRRCEMLSTRLVRMIEGHWEPLAAATLGRIRSDTRLTHVGALSSDELRQRGREIVENLGHWLTGSSEQEVSGRFERLGALRRTQEMPLDEVVLAYLIVKDTILDFIRAQGLGRDAMEVYAEEELEHAVGHVFDSMIYHIVHGYASPSARKATSAA